MKGEAAGVRYGQRLLLDDLRQRLSLGHRYALYFCHLPGWKPLLTSSMWQFYQPVKDNVWISLQTWHPLGPHVSISITRRSEKLVRWPETGMWPMKAKKKLAVINKIKCCLFNCRADMLAASLLCDHVICDNIVPLVLWTSSDDIVISLGSATERLSGEATQQSKKISLWLA